MRSTSWIKLPRSSRKCFDRRTKHASPARISRVPLRLQTRIGTTQASSRYSLMLTPNQTSKTRASPIKICTSHTSPTAACKIHTRRIFRYFCSNSSFLVKRSPISCRPRHSSRNFLTIFRTNSKCLTRRSPAASQRKRTS